MKIDVKGIVIKETVLGSDNRLINILTETDGIITALVCCGSAGRNKKVLSSHVFSYCNFTLSKTNSGYIVNEVDVIKVFCNVSYSIESLCIAQYLCEICLVVAPEKRYISDFFRLFLNSIFYISNRKKSLRLVKLIFEIRCCAMTGYMPDILCCRICKSYESEIMYFEVERGNIVCKSCAEKNYYPRDFSLNKGMVFALRHIIFSEIDNLFSFNLSDKALDMLSALSEKYIVYHVYSDFKSLKFLNDCSKIS